MKAQEFSSDETSDFREIFTAGLVAGLLAVLLNNFYSYLYTAFTGFRLPELIHIGTVTLASFFSCLLAAIFYFVLAQYTKFPKAAFMTVGGIFMLVSLLGPLTATLPDGSQVPSGFAGLTMPMHLITGICAIIVIPVFSVGDNK